MRLTIFVIILIMILGAGLAWLAGSGALAGSVRAAAVAQIAQALGREVRVARLAGDPLRGIVLDGVRIAAPPGERGTFFDVTRIVLRFHPLTLLVDLLRGRGPAASLATIELDRPVLVLSRDAADRWNYPRLPQRRCRFFRPPFRACRRFARRRAPGGSVAQRGHAANFHRRFDLQSLAPRARAALVCGFGPHHRDASQRKNGRGSEEKNKAPAHPPRGRCSSHPRT